MENTLINKEKVFGKLKAHDQARLIEFYDLIEGEENKQKFLSQLDKVDYNMIGKLFNTFYKKSNNQFTEMKENKISPIESNFSSYDFIEENRKEIVNIGMNKVNEGKVALLILAGGQGSRLGFDGPKGKYDVGMPSHKSLFEYFCGRFLKIQLLSKSIVNNNKFNSSLLLIMTSIENHAETVEFFKDNNYFNIAPHDIVFFPQDTLPAIDLEGKIINKKADEIFEAPNGNGGCFIALKNHKVIEKCLERNIEFINVISVDNPLSKPLDPFFIGVTVRYGKAKEFQMSAKVVPKREASEAVGVFLNLNGMPVMMDYGDMPKELTELRDEKGELVYRGGNILNYLISVKLLNNVLLDENKYDELINEFHVSKKKIQSVTVQEGLLKDTITEGIKFELFFNSIFKFSQENGLLLLEVNREEEFAPIKNGENSTSDNPKTCRKMMTDLFTKWYEKAGGKILNPDNINYLLEMSYLLSYDGENVVPLENIPEVIEVTKDHSEFLLK